MKLSLFLDVAEKQTDWPRSSFQNPPPCRQHVPHVHLGCFFRYLVSVCVSVLCVCVRVNASMGFVCVRVVKTEAAPGCPAYTQTVPSLNHLTVPSTIHCPEHVFHLMCVLVEMKDTRGEERENKKIARGIERGCINTGCQSNFGLSLR